MTATWIFTCATTHRPTVCNYTSANHLYINDGAGKFSDRAAAHKVDFIDASLMPAFADYDLDGDLDFFVGGRFIPGQYPRTHSFLNHLSWRGEIEAIEELMQA